jgi:uncharacterized phage protein (TIGR01671 family)
MIKFRAWHKELKKMLMVQQIEWFGDTSNISSVIISNATEYNECDDGLSKLELMQFTGLTDNNAVEIFEGDVIIDDFLNRRGVICFGEHETSSDYYASKAYGFYIKYKNDEPESLPADVLVVGNIYENGWPIES